MRFQNSKVCFHKKLYSGRRFGRVVFTFFNPSINYFRISQPFLLLASLHIEDHKDLKIALLTLSFPAALVICQNSTLFSQWGIFVICVMFAAVSHSEFFLSFFLNHTTLSPSLLPTSSNHKVLMKDSNILVSFTPS